MLGIDGTNIYNYSHKKKDKGAESSKKRSSKYEF